jgi:lipoprotein-releasing system ATP-binding protein
MTVLLEAKDLVRILPAVVPVTLVDGVSMTVHEKEFIAITGPSGSGKSSLLYLLGLLDRPTSGTLYIGGKNTEPMNEIERAQTRLVMLGFVFQFHFLLPEFTVRENVEIPMRRLGQLSRAAMRQRADDLLNSLGLEGHLDKRPDQLSGGQRQRVAVARALANDPPLVLADEPTGSLDSHSSEQVFEILKELVRERGKTVISVTHDVNMAERMDRRIHFVDGRIYSETRPNRTAAPAEAK